MEQNGTIENVIIVGSGPAACTAAIYAARANLAPLVFEGFMAGGVAAGGQLTTTTEVENFPGFPEGIMGPVLMENMRQQAVHHGARFLTETVHATELRGTVKKLSADSGDYQAKAVIIATGATAKRMDLPGEQQFWQRGVSACAVCDGALPLFRNQVLVVIGGGDTACEEADYLSKFGSKVVMLVRRDVLRASRAMQKRVLENPKIEVLWHHEALELLGDKTLHTVRVKHNQTGAVSDIAAKGLFFAIGHQPNTAFLAGQLPVDETGYLLTRPDSCWTGIEGVYAAGDVKDKVYRQAITAAGSGCMAALEVERWLAGQGQH